MELWIIVIVFMALVAAILITVAILKKMKGSIDLIPEKFNYSPGEMVKGKLILKLKKPVNSTELIVGIRCEKTERTYTGKGTSTNTVTVFDFNQPLEKRKEYPPSEYPYSFSIKIPQSATSQMEGISGSIIKSLQILANQNTSLRWYLYAELKCDGLNLSKKVQINI